MPTDRSINGMEDDVLLVEHQVDFYVLVETN
jgi:hypothetical protein